MAKGANKMSQITRNDPLVFHLRIKNKETVAAKGGATIVFLPEFKRFGIALCCDKDRYDKRVGRNKAQSRASGNQDIHRRFNLAPQYDGEMEFASIRAAALTLANRACAAVGNPVEQHTPLECNSEFAKHF